MPLTFEAFFLAPAQIAYKTLLRMITPLSPVCSQPSRQFGFCVASGLFRNPCSSDGDRTQSSPFTASGSSSPEAEVADLNFVPGDQAGQQKVRGDLRFEIVILKTCGKQVSQTCRVFSHAEAGFQNSVHTGPACASSLAVVRGQLLDKDSKLW